MPFKSLSLQKEAFGLDISDLSLKIIKLKKNKKGFGIASFGEMDIEPGIIRGGVIQDEDTLAKVIRSLCKTVKGERLNTNYVVASLPEEKSFLDVVQMPDMSEQELKSAIIFEAENYIPLPINEVYLDFKIITALKHNNGHLDVLIAAAPKKIVNSYVSCLKKAGLAPLAFEIESEAIVRSLVKNEISPCPLAIIDFGKTSTDFIIFSGRSIRFTSSIPISSDQLTMAISKSLEVDTQKAEKIKVRDGINHADKDEKLKKVFQAISPVLEDLVAQTKKYLNFYQDHISHEHILTGKIENILLCGGGAVLKGLPEFLTKKLEIPVRLADFWIDIPSAKPASEYLSFTTAIGLALREVNNSENK